VDGEDDDREDVEETPERILEDLVLQLVAITYWNCSHAGVAAPEELELKDS
jgi:hypothetical protein